MSVPLVVFLLLPLAGYIVGSVAFLHRVPGQTSFIINVSLVVLTFLSIISGISFRYEWLDESVICAALFTMGYTGTRLKNVSAKGLRMIIIGYRMTTGLYYILLPFCLYWLFIAAFVSNPFPETVAIHDDHNVRIKHIRKNGGFNFAGHHFIEVYQTFAFIEYPVDHFSMGEYGQYTFEHFANKNDTKIPQNIFRYDSARGELIYYAYTGDHYVGAKRFVHK